MSEKVFLFPGQGAQFVGMGRDFYDEFDYCRQLFEKASEYRKADVARICFEESDKLNMTENTQVAILTVELCALKVLKREYGIIADYSAGLSLGEYAAAVTSGALSEDDALKIVCRRGKYMQEACHNGGMAAIIGLDSATIREMCRQEPRKTDIANYNSPQQFVVSGLKEEIEDVAARCKEAGAIKTVVLKVSGPFHSVWMEPAKKKLTDDFRQIAVHEIVRPYISNVNGEYITDKSQVIPLFEEQIIHPVLWLQTMKKFQEKEGREYYEVGPGKALRGFARQMPNKITVTALGTLEAIRKCFDRQEQTA